MTSIGNKNLSLWTWSLRAYKKSYNFRSMRKVAQKHKHLSHSCFLFVSNFRYCVFAVYGEDKNTGQWKDYCSIFQLLLCGCLTYALIVPYLLIAIEKGSFDTLLKRHSYRSTILNAIFSG
jgi:hypothetical protein